MVTFCIALRNGFASLLPAFATAKGFAEVLGVGGFSVLASASLLRALRLTIYRQCVLIERQDKSRPFSLDVFMLVLYKL